MKNNKDKLRSFARGFGYAAKGVCCAVRTERNLRFHLCAGAYVYVLSLFYPFGAVEYVLLTLLVCGVLSLELVNSALERVVDKASPERSRLAGEAKDMAAGAVLVFCVGAAVCGLVLFSNRAGLLALAAFLRAYPAALLLLALSLAAAWWFVFCAFPAREMPHKEAPAHTGKKK